MILQLIGSTARKFACDKAGKAFTLVPGENKVDDELVKFATKNNKLFRNFSEAGKIKIGASKQPVNE